MVHRILHVSDLHVGPPFLSAVADALVRQAHEVKPELLVVSGDFVQRADHIEQWRGARELLDALPGPKLVVPGNHDVPLYNLPLRLLNPLGRYRRYISKELNPVFELPGLGVVGVATAHGLTTDGGRISSGQAARLRAALNRLPEDAARVVVWHHPVVNPPGLHRNRVMSHADEAMRLLEECNVELLLCGHIHVSYIGNTLDVERDLRQGTIICQSGTSTSRRGYGREHGKNSCNLIEIDKKVIRISQLLYLEDAGRFVPFAEHSFPRRGRGVYELPRSEREVRVEG